jgi:hypothetical protein
MIGPSDCLPDWLSPILDNLDPDGKIRAALDAPRGPAPTVAAGDLDRFTPDERIRRARAYLAAMPAGVQGQNGSGATYSAACAMVHGFALDPDAALEPVARRLQPAVRSAVVGPRAVAQGRGRGRKEHAEPRRLSCSPAARPTSSRTRPERPRPSAPPRPPGRWASDDGRRAGLATGATFLEHDDDPYRIARGILAGYGTPGPPDAGLLA